MARVLYITYDGLTDPLGQSQILPYLQGLSSKGHRFTVLSCEKADAFERNRQETEKILKASGINWVPLAFHRRPPILAKFWDLFRLKQAALRLHKQNAYELIHCRSYLAVDVGLWLKRRRSTKVLFDMRGFWVDERVAAGLWNQTNMFYRLAYRRYKTKEGLYIGDSDALIILAKAGKQEIETWPTYRGTPLRVIPCCVDFSIFKAKTHESQKAARLSLGLKPDDFVFVYLGSLGTWYKIEDMLRFFKIAQNIYPQSKFLFLTQDPTSLLEELARRLNLSISNIVSRSATRKEVARYLPAADIALSFIEPSYAKRGSSPTKLGELLAVGLPVVTNGGIGDVAEIIKDLDGGVLVKDFSDSSFEEIISTIPDLIKKNPQDIHNRSRNYYDLQKGVASYNELYEELINDVEPRKSSKA